MRVNLNPLIKVKDSPVIIPCFVKSNTSGVVKVGVWTCGLTVIRLDMRSKHRVDLRFVIWGMGFEPCQQICINDD